MEPAITRRRHPSLVRTGTPEPIRITERDVAIFRLVAKHRLLRSSHITALLANRWNAHETLRRLGPLFRHRYLDRPLNQRYLVPPGTGSWPYIHALGPLGALYLAEHFGRTELLTDWARKNAEILPEGDRGLRHTLGIADALVRIELECRSRSDIRFIPPEEIIASIPAALHRPGSTYPVAWRTTVTLDGQRTPVNIEPDGLFGLEFANRPENRRFKFFVLEVDAGTRTQDPTKNWQKSNAYKLARYFAAWQNAEAGSEPPLFGLPNWRVLSLSPSPKRSENLVTANQKITGGTGSRIFNFADFSQTVSHGMLTLPWTNGRGEMVRLLDS